MPDWTNYHSSYVTETLLSSDFYVTIPTVSQMRQDEEYQRECEREDRIYELQLQMQRQEIEQEIEEEKQLDEDRSKYPLFFIKEGIV